MPPASHKPLSSNQSWGVAILGTIALVYFTVFIFLFKRPQEHITELYFADRMTEAHRILINQYNELHAGKIRVIPVNYTA